MGAHAGSWSAFNAFGIEPQTDDLETTLLYLAREAALAAKEGGERYDKIIYALKKILAEARAIYYEMNNSSD